MISDDLTALAGISIGALASTALTLSLAARDPAPVVVHPQPAPVTQAVPCVTPADRHVIDFAIIRSDGDRQQIHVMVGPEGPHSGWVRPQEVIGPLRRSDR